MKSKQPANAQLACRVTNEDYATVEQMARVSGQSKSEFLRLLIHTAAEDWRNLLGTKE